MLQITRDFSTTAHGPWAHSGYKTTRGASPSNLKAVRRPLRAHEYSTSNYKMDLGEDIW